VLTNITIYWVTQTIQASIYGYLAETRQPSLGPAAYVDRPVGRRCFRRIWSVLLRGAWAERSLNVVRWREMPRGAAFWRWELPEEFCRRPQRLSSAPCGTSTLRHREQNVDTGGQAFEIHVGDPLLADLATRLQTTRLPPVQARRLGCRRRPAYLKALLEYWRKRYDWRVQSAVITLAIRAEVNGADIHFIHERGRARRRCH